MHDLCIYSDLVLFSFYSSSSSCVITWWYSSLNFSFNVCVASMLLVILFNTSCKFFIYSGYMEWLYTFYIYM